MFEKYHRIRILLYDNYVLLDCYQTFQLRNFITPRTTHVACKIFRYKYMYWFSLVLLKVEKFVPSTGALTQF